MRVLVDTNIWIDHLRQTEPVLVDLLERDQVRAPECYYRARAGQSQGSLDLSESARALDDRSYRGRPRGPAPR